MKKKLPEQSEHQAQVSIFRWAEIMAKKDPDLRLLNGSLNGVRLPIGAAIKAKRCGMRPGFPDIFLPVPKNGWHGLFIELKRESGGSITKDQKWWIAQLLYRKYYAVVCRGKDHAIKTIQAYLEGKTEI